MQGRKHTLLGILERAPLLYEAVRKVYRSKIAQSIRFSIRKGGLCRSLHWLSRGHLARRLIVKEYLAGPKKNLQVGGGHHTIDGWLNGDILAGNIYLDARKPLPLPGNTFDFIFAEQFIEHISLEQGRIFCQESYRVLKPGAVIRLSTPDLERLIQTYHDENPCVTLAEAIERHESHHNPELSTACHFLNDYFRLWGHTFIYDEETLTDVLMAAGFVGVTRYRFGESKFEALADKERHADCEWMKNGWALILEGYKIND